MNELFDQLADGPVFTPENKAPEKTPNSPELYELLPIDRDFDRRFPAVNAAASGWCLDRDDPALDAYIRPIAAAACEPAVMNAISWHDQGALIWAIQSLGLENRVLQSSRWNLCVDHVPLAPELMVWDAGVCGYARPCPRLLSCIGMASAALEPITLLVVLGARGLEWPRSGESPADPTEFAQLAGDMQLEQQDINRNQNKVCCINSGGVQRETIGHHAL